MKNFRLLIAALALCLVVSPLLGQSLTITKDFAQVPMASVLAMYISRLAICCSGILLGEPTNWVAKKC